MFVCLFERVKAICETQKARYFMYVCGDKSIFFVDVYVDVFVDVFVDVLWTFCGKSVDSRNINFILNKYILILDKSVDT